MSEYTTRMGKKNDGKDGKGYEARNHRRFSRLCPFLLLGEESYTSGVYMIGYNLNTMKIKTWLIRYHKRLSGRQERIK